VLEELALGLQADPLELVAVVVALVLEELALGLQAAPSRSAAGCSSWRRRRSPGRGFNSPLADSVRMCGIL
jgi:hypothetical protein